MAVSSSTPKLVLLSLISLSLLATLAFAHDHVSIVGYSPDDLKSTTGLINLFESWMTKHGKNYKSVGETLHKFEVFKDNVKYIEKRNKVVNYWLGLNEFSDLSFEEFKSMYTGLEEEVEFPSQNTEEEFIYKDIVDLPKSIDWRTKGAVTPVKNQGRCGKYIYIDH